MKKTFYILLLIMLLSVLSACHQAEKEQLLNVMNQEIQAEETYTPKSYQQYTAALDRAQSVYDGIFSDSDEIAEAQKELQKALDALHPLPDKSALAKLIERKNNLNESLYTTDSFTALTETASTASKILQDENATQAEVDTASSSLENSINGLVKATKGVYKLNCSLDLISNNSVGNEWSTAFTHNGKSIQDGDTIALPLNRSLTITGSVTEQDSIPDYGSGFVRLTTDGTTKSKTIYVRENRGRYSGNLAVWQLEGSVELLSTQ